MCSSVPRWRWLIFSLYGYGDSFRLFAPAFRFGSTNVASVSFQQTIFALTQPMLWRHGGWGGGGTPSTNENFTSTSAFSGSIHQLQFAHKSIHIRYAYTSTYKRAANTHSRTRSLPERVSRYAFVILNDCVAIGNVCNAAEAADGNAVRCCAHLSGTPCI